MNTLVGECKCQNIKFELEVSFPPGSFSPRSCDCDFCLENRLSYISDPAGSAKIQFVDQFATTKVRQGSQTAEFLKCVKCGTVVGAFYTDGDQVFASLNANLIQQKKFFAPSLVVSPKKLGTEEKKTRWRQLWFHKVRFEMGAKKS